jgi:hypothetical protein
MSESARYIKIVEWSDEDQCFVGQCPGGVAGAPWYSFELGP